MDKIQIIIVDSHPVFRQGLERLLKDEPDIDVVGQAVSGEDAIALAGQSQPDVAIVDLDAPSLNGMETTKQIRQVSPRTAVLIIGHLNYHTHILAALRAGAAGYLTRDTPLTELIQAIRLAYEGKGLLERDSAIHLIRRLKDDQERHKTSLDLYPREIEVLKMTAKGLRNKEIARELSISERTVQSHLSNIFSKLDVASRTEAVLQALKDGWLDISDFT
jgi:two-component system, NarL family, response regulator LiaR